MGGVVASLAPHFHGEEALRKKSWVFSKLCLFKNAQSQLGPAPPSTPTSRVVPASSGSGRDPYALDAPSVEVPSLVTSCFLPWVLALQQYHQPHIVPSLEPWPHLREQGDCWDWEALLQPTRPQDLPRSPEQRRRKP